MAGDLRISELPPLAGALLEASDPIAVADLSASESKRITAKDLLQYGVALLDDGSIPAGKVQAYALGDGEVTTQKLADDAVTAAKLADNSSVSVVYGLPATGDFIGQIVLDRIDGLAHVWAGAWLDWKTSGGLNYVVGGSDGLVVTTVDAAGAGTADIRATLEPTTGARQFLAGPSAAGGAVAQRVITGADLPPASASELGAVIVNANGLRITAGGALEIDNDVLPSDTTYGVVTYDANGLVTDGRAITSLDLPLASTGITGAVSPGPEFEITATGEIRHRNLIQAGTAPKITYDANGHVVSSAGLAPDDIPGLDASKIISGEFDSSRIGYNSISAYQLADYGIAHVLQSRPVPEFAGQFWINPVDRSAYIWVGTVNGPESDENGYWMSIGYGSALDQTIRLGGTYDASTNTIESLNSIGTATGLVVGQPLPSPMPANNGVYLLVTSVGQGVTPAPVEPLAVGDWVFSLGTGTNWQKISVISGAGGFVRDDDVLVEGTTFLPAMDGVVNQFEANRLLWNYVQVASGVERGTVKPSSEVLVDAVTAVMHIGIIDCGEY